MVSYQQSHVLVLWLTAQFYGIYAVIFAISIYILVFREHRSTINKRLLLVTVTLFVLCTAQNITYFLQTFLTADVLANGYYPGETDAQLREKETYDLLNCLSDAFTATANVIADALLIWRCYTVWGRKYSVVIAPILILIAGSVCGYADVVVEAKIYALRIRLPLTTTTPPPEWDQLNNLDNYLFSAFYGTSFITNMLMSTLIAGRIWWMTRESRQFFGRRYGNKYRRTASLIIESGAIYSLCLLLIAVLAPLISYESNTTALDAIELITFQIVGIVPTLIIVLVALGRTSDQSTLRTTGPLDGQASSSPNIEFAQPNATRGVMTETHNIDLEMADISKTDAEDSLGKKSDPRHGIAIVSSDS